MSDLIRSSRDGAVANITIDRPGDGNVLTLDMLRALTTTIRTAAASDAKVIVLRTTGADFCRGRDPKGGPANPTALVLRDQVLQPILDVYDALNSAPQPVVCAVQGAALGFGCAMATACDVTIAADNATFKLPEMAHNLPPTLAISALMPKVPRKALAWMVYTMPEIDAQTGIVSAVVPLAKLDAAMAETLNTMTARAPRRAERGEGVSPHGADDGATRRRRLRRRAAVGCAGVRGALNPLLSSPRRRGPIRRGLSMWHDGRKLSSCGGCWCGRRPTASLCQNEVVEISDKGAVREADYPNWNGYVEAYFSTAWG